MILKDGDEAEVRIVERLDRTVEPTTQRLEQAHVVETLVTGRREAPELGEDSLSRWTGNERRGRTQEPFGAFLMRKPSSASSLTARRRRSGSSRKTESETARMRPLARSALPPNGSHGSPDPTRTAIALNVKSREARSASMRSGSGVKSTV